MDNVRNSLIVHFIKNNMANVLYSNARQFYACWFSRSSNAVLAEMSDGTIEVWDAQTDGGISTGSTRTTVSSKWPYNVRLYRGNWSVVRFLDDTITIWDPFTWTRLHMLHNVDNKAHCAFSPDGVFMAIVSEDDTIRIWNVHTNMCVRTLPKHPDVWDCAYSSDGAMFVVTSISGNISGNIEVWNPADGVCMYSLQSRTNDRVTCLFSPRDGNLLATVFDNIQLWNVRTGVCLDTLGGRASTVYMRAFSLDGVYLATVSNDKTTRIWNVYTGACVHSIQTLYTPACCDFSFDGSLLVTTSHHSYTAHVYRLPSLLRNSVKLLLMIIVGRYRRGRLWLPIELWDWINTQWFFYQSA